MDISGFLNGLPANTFFYPGRPGYSLFSGLKHPEMVAIDDQYSFSLLASTTFAHPLS
jgi:hypothetical protein